MPIVLVARTARLTTSTRPLTTMYRSLTWSPSVRIWTCRGSERHTASTLRCGLYHHHELGCQDLDLQVVREALYHFTASTMRYGLYDHHGRGGSSGYSHNSASTEMAHYHLKLRILHMAMFQ